MNLLVLTYHYFHRERPSGIKAEDFSFSVGLDRFEKHCEELASSGYKLIDPDRLVDSEAYGEKAERQILMTIDDGHVSVEEAIETILNHRIKPVLNIATDIVGTGHYLDWPAIRNLALQGFSVQSHSKSHRNLTKLDDGELKDELEESKKIIEDNIGLPVTMLAAPMGRIDKRVAEAAERSGYEIIMTSFTGINRGMQDLKYMRRFQVKSGRGALMVDDYFKAMSDVRMIGAAKNLAKRIRNRFNI